MKNELWTSFSNTGSEVGLPAFQLPTYAKCDALPQRDFFGMFVSGVGSCRSFLQRHFFSWRDQRVCKQGLTHWVGSRESQPSSNIVRVDVWVVNQWWIRMILACEFSVPKFAVLARSKKLMPVAVKFRLGFLVCGLQVHLLWHQAISAPCPCNKTEAAMKNCRDWVFSHGGLEVWWPGFQMSVFGKCDSLPKRGLCEMFV